jgi:hypothetical protein
VTPPAILLDQLTSARSAGAQFTDAWPGALQAALRGAHRAEREEWVEAFAATVEAWRSAWAREAPSVEERALPAATGGREAPGDAESCEQCWEPMPARAPGFQKPRRFCSNRCRRAHWHERQKLAA